MVLKKEEFFDRLHSHIGTDTSEDSITFIEDITDTYNDLEKRANGDGIDWEKKFYDLDESWRERYRHRFFSGGDSGNANSRDAEKEIEREDISVEDLFEKEEK